MRNTDLQMLSVCGMENGKVLGCVNLNMDMDMKREKEKGKERDLGLGGLGGM